MNKKQIRLTESDLKQIVKESVNRILKEDQKDKYYEITCLNAFRNLVDEKGLQSVVLNLGREIGWEKLYIAMYHAFNGYSNDSEQHDYSGLPGWGG